MSRRAQRVSSGERRDHLTTQIKRVTPRRYVRLNASERHSLWPVGSPLMLVHARTQRYGDGRQDCQDAVGCSWVSAVIVVRTTGVSQGGFLEIPMWLGRTSRVYVFISLAGIYFLF
jgi:uncharacterized protein YbdZ (MbtH family)